MNGARPVPERKTRTANTSSTMIRGRSHHFLFSFMNPQRSAKKPLRLCSAAARSKSDFCDSFFTQQSASMAEPRPKVTTVLAMIRNSVRQASNPPTTESRRIRFHQYLHLCPPRLKDHRGHQSHLLGQWCPLHIQYGGLEHSDRRILVARSCRCFPQNHKRHRCLLRRRHPRST